MNVIPLKTKYSPWSETEKNIFINIHSQNIYKDFQCDYIFGTTDAGHPYFSLFKMNGEEILHIARGQNGIGYFIKSSILESTFVQTIRELFIESPETNKEELASAIESAVKQVMGNKQTS